MPTFCHLFAPFLGPRRQLNPVGGRRSHILDPVFPRCHITMRSVAVLGLLGLARADFSFTIDTAEPLHTVSDTYVAYNIDTGSLFNGMNFSVRARITPVTSRYTAFSNHSPPLRTHRTRSSGRSSPSSAPQSSASAAPRSTRRITSRPSRTSSAR